jgi:hypothetical protein
MGELKDQQNDTDTHTKSPGDTAGLVVQHWVVMPLFPLQAANTLSDSGDSQNC